MRGLKQAKFVGKVRCAPAVLFVYNSEAWTKNALEFVINRLSETTSGTAGQVGSEAARASDPADAPRRCCRRAYAGAVCKTK
jgi:hypothetical protein